MATDLNYATDMTQRAEKPGYILIAIVDETYGTAEDDTWEEQRERFRLQLEEEFGVSFGDANIGPSADLPAFATLLDASVPAWIVLLGAFFLGKPISENLAGWREIGGKVRSFFKRPAYLNRQGAAALAVEHVMDAIGTLPTTLELVSYRIIHTGDDSKLVDLPRGSEIAAQPPTLFLGFVAHVFEIEADGVTFRVGVEGRRVEAIRLDDEPGRRD